MDDLIRVNALLINEDEDEKEEDLDEDVDNVDMEKTGDSESGDDVDVSNWEN